MFKRLLNFVRYNNAFAIGFSILFLSVGGVLAASPDVREAVAEVIIKGDTTIIATDNTYLLGTDFDTYLPKVLIVEVTEDDEYYYVEYVLTTIDIQDKVWQDIEKSRVMKVSKELLDGSDLGLYVTKQLKEVVDYELARLEETQEIEQRFGVSTKIVATAYSGLVGKFLDSKEEHFPGYRPVIKPEDTAGQDSVQSQSGSDSGGGDAIIPDIQILGDNPTLVELGSTYTDLGAVVTDNVDANVVLITSGSVDTTAVGDYQIIYTAVDSSGNEAVKKRIVTVFDSNGNTGSGGGGGTGGSSSSTPPPTSTTTPPVSTTTPPSATTTEEVVDTTPPVITIAGSVSVEIGQGQEYFDEGATALDDVDGDLTAAIIIENSVDTNVPATYIVNYSVSDVAGNNATANREVIVVQVSENTSTTSGQQETSSSTQSAE